MMTRSIPVALLLAALGARPVAAALPPQFQRLIELRAILDDGRVTARFDLTHPIEKIDRVAHDLYRLTSGPCHRDVEVKDDPTVRHPRGWAGPRSFVLQAGPLTCK